MSKTDDGGPAFPTPVIVAPTINNSAPLKASGHCASAINAAQVHIPAPSGGMSLRDWFAGQAMAAMLAKDDLMPTDKIADAAYYAADAMLAARKDGDA